MSKYILNQTNQINRFCVMEKRSYILGNKGCFGMAEKYIVKICKVEQLENGMLLAKTIYDPAENIHITVGTALDASLILKLQERFRAVEVFEVYDDRKAIRDSNVLDAKYVGKYQSIYIRLQDIYIQARQKKNVDIEAIENLIEAGGFMQMVDGFKAITQVHNIPRDSDYLVHHSIRVAILLGVLGQWLKMNKEILRELVLTGLLYEIGNTQIPQEILDNPRTLTEEETKQVQQHAMLGFELLRYGQLKGRDEILFGVLQHHERLDGSGYPGGMREDNICEFARMIAIADTYDAMAAQKIYLQPMSPFAIFNILADDIAEKKLDANYGVLFVENMRRALNGNWVCLSDDSLAKIIYINEKDMRAQPIVQTQGGEFVDLNKDKALSIIRLLTEDKV